MPVRDVVCKNGVLSEKLTVPPVFARGRGLALITFVTAICLLMDSKSGKQ